MEITNTTDTLSEEIYDYVNRGFGSMNKNDFEVWIFNEFLKQNEGMLDSEISRKLKISETKVKRLEKEAYLIYGNEDKGIKKISDDLIEKYLKYGLGRMNKNDFEVWIFHYLLEKDYKDLSDNIISRKLRIPKTKVSRLHYEAELKFQYNDEYYKKRFYEILNTRVYKTVENNTRIQFSITEKALRLYLDDILESYGSYADSSFNSNIVTLTASDLLLLIANFENKQDLIKKVKESLKRNNYELPKEDKEIFLEGVTAILKDIGDHFAPNVTKFFSDNLK